MVSLGFLAVDDSTAQMEFVSENCLLCLVVDARVSGVGSNLPAAKMNGAGVIAAYHDLWQVEKSFRMAKSDLRARPIFHRQHDSIEAHLTIVFAALAISRHLQEASGMSIKKVVKTLKVVRSATVRINGEEIILEPEIPEPAAELLDSLGYTGH